MKTSARLYVVLAAVATLSLLQTTLGQETVPATTLTTDLPGYRPGGIVQIAGSGFQAGETVTLQVFSEPRDNAAARFFDPFTVGADETGAIAAEWHIRSVEGISATLHLVASGGSSGRNAATSLVIGAAIKACRTTMQPGEESGSEIQVLGGGFEPGESIILEIVPPEDTEEGGSTYEQSTVITDAQGTLHASLAVVSEASASVQVLATRDAMVPTAEGVVSQNAEPCPAFLSATVYEAGSNPSCVAGNDFNGDGKLDLVVANAISSGTVSVLAGKGDGTFQPRSSYAVGSTPVCLYSGDLNGDGKADVAVANSGSANVSVLLGNGDGTFQARVNYGAGTSPVAVAGGDFNGDGILDLAVVNSASGSVSLLRGNGNGTFQTRVNYPTGSSPRHVGIADFNCDGRLDLVVANYNSQTASVLRGNGDGTFQAALNCTAGYTYSVAVGDFDKDGKPDMALANLGSHSISVLRGKGDGTFHPRVIYSTAQSPISIAAADLDGDGAADLVVGHSTSAGTVSLLRGLNGGAFDPAQTYAVEGSFPRCVAAADFNGDGKLDVAVANNSSATVSVLTGNLCAAANVPPVARCKNVTVFAGANCAAEASIDDGSWDPEAGTITLAQTPPGPYPTGVTEVTLTVTDVLGLSDSCTATVTVVDNTMPTINPPADVVVASDAGSHEATSVNLGEPAVADNCGVAGVSNDHSSSIFPLGTTFVTWTVVDTSGNAATCVQRVTVIRSIHVSLLPPSDKALKFPPNRVIPIKARLVDSSGAAVTRGVSVQLRVHRMDSSNPQEVLEKASGVGIGGTENSDGIMVLNQNVYQFNLNTRNLADSRPAAYAVTITAIDEVTGTALGSAGTTLEIRK